MKAKSFDAQASSSPTAPRDGPREDPDGRQSHPWNHPWAKRFAWLVLAAGVLLGLYAFEVDVVGWFADVWGIVSGLSPQVIAFTLVFATIGKLLGAVPWLYALRASYPGMRVTYKAVLAANQSGTVIDTVAPANLGVVVELGVKRLAFPGSRLPTIVAITALISFMYVLISLIAFALLLIVERPRVFDSRRLATALDFAGEHRLLVVGLAAALVLIAVIVVRRCRPKIAEVKAQLLQGGAILRTQRRLLWLVVAAAVLSYLMRYAQTAVFMAAFDIPVTAGTLILVVVGRQFSSFIAVTPGGIASKVAVDVLVLNDYAPSDVIVAFSLGKDAVTRAWNVVFGIGALVWAFGRSGARAILTDRESFVAAGRDTAEAAGRVAKVPEARPRVLE